MANALHKETCSRLLDLFGIDDDKLSTIESKTHDGLLSREMFLQVLMGRDDLNTALLPEAEQKKKDRLDKLFDLLDTPDPETGVADGELSKSELKSFVKSNPVFAEEHKTATLSFGFSISERTAFLNTLIVKSHQKKSPYEEDNQTTTSRASGAESLSAKDFYCNKHDFIHCWESARGFPPSDRTVQKVVEIYRKPDQDDERVSIDALDFAQRCMGNAGDMGSQPFQVAFFKNQLQKHKDIAGLVYFIPFLVLFTVYLLSGKGIGTGYFMHVQNDQLLVDESFEMPCVSPCNKAVELTYNDVGESAQFYEWLRSIVIPTFWTGSLTETADDPLQFHVYPFGALRIESLRVPGVNYTWQQDYYFGGDAQNSSHEDYSSAQKLFPNMKQGDLGLSYPLKTDCSAPVADDFSVGLDNTTVSYLREAFSYNDCTSDATQCVRGRIGHYPCGGFNALIPFNWTKKEALQFVSELETNGWIDIQTRVVFLHHAFFNKDTRLVYRSALGYEISSGGQWIPIRRVLAFKYFNWTDKSVAWIFFLAVYLLFIVGYMLKHGVVCVRKVHRSISNLGGILRLNNPVGNAYLITRGTLDAFKTNKWMLIDVITYVFFLSVWIYRAVVWARTPNDRFYEIDHYSYHLDRYAYDMSVIDYLDTVICFLLYLRLFKYFKLFRVLDCITRTIYMASYELYGVAFTFFVVIVAFSLSGFVLYGDVLDDYATVPRSMETLLRFIVGDFDYESWAAARRVVSPMFFTLIFIVLVLILFNSLVAVLADNFSDVVKNEFDPLAWYALIERDATCSLTFEKVGFKLFDNAIVNEMARFPRWVLRKRGMPPHLGNDPREFWEHMSHVTYHIYYGTKDESIDAFLDLANSDTTTFLGLQPASMLPSVLPFGKKKKEDEDEDDAATSATVSTISEEAAIAQSMEMIHRAATTSRAADKKELGMDSTVLTLWEVLRNTFGANLEMYLILGVHRPFHALNIRRAELVISLIDTHFLWKQQQTGIGNMNDASEQVPNLEKKFFELKKKHQRFIERERQLTEIHQLEKRNPNATDGLAQRRQSLVANIDGQQSLEVMKTQASYYGDEEYDPWSEMLYKRALFSGLAPEISVEQHPDYETFMEEWELEHKRWRTDKQVEHFYELDVVKHVIDSDVYEKFKHSRKDASNLDMAQVMKVGFRASQLRTFTQLLQEYVSDKRADAKKHGKEIPDTIDKIDMETFKQFWHGAVGSRMNEKVESNFNILSIVMYGEPGFVSTDRFVANCTSTLTAHSNKSFPGQFFANQRRKVFDVTNLALYVPFLALFTYLMVASYGGENSRISQSIYGNVLDDKFEDTENERIGFDDIRATADYYNWLRNNVANKLFRPDSGPAAFDDVNIGLGAFRVRQLRAEAETNCGYKSSVASDDFYADRVAKHFSGQCVPSWSEASRSKASFGNPDALSNISKEAFEYSGCAWSSNIYADNSIYGCGGHSLVLPYSLNNTEAVAIIDEVEKAGWITIQTRALIAESFYYNFNNDIVTRQQYVMEVTAGGLFVPGRRTDAFQLFKTNAREWYYYFIMGLFVALLAFSVTIYAIDVVRQILHIKHTMSSSTWQAILLYARQDKWWPLEVLNYSIFIVVWCLRFSTMTTDTSILTVYGTSGFPSDLIRHAEIGYGILVLDCFNALLCYIKVFKYVVLQSQLNILINALDMAAKSIAAIFLISFVLLSGFALSGYMVFGSTVVSMSDMSTVFETLTVASIPGEGEDALRAWYADRPIFAGFYYTLIVIGLLVLMLNMMTSVVAQAYAESKNLQFDPRPLQATIAFDPSIDGGRWYSGLINNPATRELMYWLGRVFYGLRDGCSDNEGNVMKLKLQNPRHFYATMTTLVAKLENGSPRDASVAALELLYVKKFGSRMARSKYVRDAHAIEAALMTKPPCKLYGVPRQIVRQYSEKNMPVELASTIENWCVSVPSQSLNLSRDMIVTNVFEMMLPWKKEAKTYCEIDDAKDEEERFDLLKEYVKNIKNQLGLAEPEKIIVGENEPTAA